MNRKGLFISNYCRIEQDVVELSQNVEFCDEQLDVYSVVICDLIIRCCADIESLYRELYARISGKKMPRTIGEAVSELDLRLGLTNKILDIDNLGFSFNTFRTIRPFGYEKKTGDDFYYVFCQLKHSRHKSLQRATLRILILSLGALYILNQYYLNEQLPIENSFFGEIIPATLSKMTHVFSAPVFNETWSVVDSRLNTLKSLDGITDDTISKIKNALITKMNIKPSQRFRHECLFKVETTPEYKKISKALVAENFNDEESKAVVLSLFFSDNKEIDKLLDEYGISVLDPILSLLSATIYRNRLRIVMNRQDSEDEPSANTL